MGTGGVLSMLYWILISCNILNVIMFLFFRNKKPSKTELKKIETAKLLALEELDKKHRERIDIIETLSKAELQEKLDEVEQEITRLENKTLGEK